MQEGSFAFGAAAATAILCAIHRRTAIFKNTTKQCPVTSSPATGKRLSVSGHPPRQSSSDNNNVTFSLMTYNLWKTAGRPTAWAARRPILLRQLRRLDPDVLLVQELCPEIAACVLEALPGHVCVKDGREAGWAQEGNVYWRASLFQKHEHGAVNIGQAEALRRLWWVRLADRRTGRSALFSTAHFTWQGSALEHTTDVNLRKALARRTAAALNRLQRRGVGEMGEGEGEPCFFGGDLNESFWPRAILTAAGFIDSFAALALPARPTHPTRPLLMHEERNADSVLDWLFSRGASVRTLLSAVIRDMAGLSSDDADERQQLAVQPSDHMPVMAVYRW